MKRTGNVCLLCEQLATRSSIRQRAAPSRWAPASQQNSRRITLRAQLESKGRGSNVVPQDLQDVPPSKPSLPTRQQPRVSAEESSKALQRAKELGTAILSNRDTVPTDQEVLRAIEACELAARQLTSNSSSLDNAGPASALLLLSGRRSDHTRPHHPASLAIGVDLLSNLAHKILLYPTVFITPEILLAYVHTQTLLERPGSLPEIFSLYARKDKPKPGTNPIQFTTVDPNAHTSAVPSDSANLALQAAIKAQDMDLCLDIINTTFRTLAWRRHKFVSRAAVPLAGLGMAPFGAYMLATQFALFPTAADPTALTMMTFAGGMTYISVVASMGFIALTTANDQMRRVTWVTGTPLRERWIREEERAAMDTVVLGFGFSEAQKSRWGDESGPEWEHLREWIGERGCVVDRVELMEGMQ